MFTFFSKIFDENAKTIDRYQKIVSQINDLEKSTKKLSDEKLKLQTKKFRTAIQNGKTLEDILPEAFATIREASSRTTGLRHFDVQLLAGLAFHEGNIAEQRTGEGKTLSATLALYLNALEGKGAHLITVNDYLAQLGAGWMGQIFSALDMSVGVIIHDQSYRYDPSFKSEDRGDDRLEHFRPVSRKEAYACDITYGTNNEFGFDYLRDNMVQRAVEVVQRELQYAIVDEADSILIDEARTPLIISAPDVEPTKKYYDYARMVDTLEKDSDYSLDEKARSATLTDLGVKRIEKKLGVSNLYEEDFDVIHHIESALKAKSLFQRDKDYIVREGEVIIVDEHTGRLMYGRRYSDGIHQSIEAKENVKIQQESRTLATVSLQNYFRLYKKLAGMTGTAATEAEEFKKIYNMNVVTIPTHLPVQRQDYSDIVYKTTAVKYGAIVAEVEEMHKLGRPVLLGTRSIQHNEIIAEYLQRKKIPHVVLNAKNHEREAFIIADAGKLGAVIVATNIAGRGVDIVLGGSKPERKDFESDSAFESAKKKWTIDHEKVVAAGGLHVIGTERHESRRIDNQLRGRAGRQGDPGSSRFFISLEDDIMRIFGGEQISKAMDFLKIEENQPIEHGMVGKAIEQAQVKVEGFFFDQRKRLVEFDDVMNKQREVIYARRRSILEQQKDQRAEIMTNIDTSIDALVSFHSTDPQTDESLNIIMREFVGIVPFDENSQKAIRQEISALSSHEEVSEKLTAIAHQVFEQREQQYGEQVSRELERFVTLSSIDELWMDHLDSMDSLREGIWLRGDKQAVLSAYKQEAFEMFSSLMSRISDTIVHRIYRVQAVTRTQMESAQQSSVELKQETFGGSIAEQAQTAQQNLEKPATTKGSLTDFASALGKSKPAPVKMSPVGKEKIGRNDPCPCGSGKKYKKCHGA